MKYLKFLIAFMMFNICVAGFAQDSLKVTFKERSRAAITNQRLKRQDRNGNFCALVQVSAPNIRNYEFVSTVKIDSVEYDDKMNTANIFIVPNYQNSTLTIISKETPSYRLNMGPLQSLHIYDLQIALVRDMGNKTRTLIMPVASAGGIMNFGLMFAFAKKVGPYFKVKYNFKNISSEHEINDAGAVDGGSQIAYLSGDKDFARLSITGGLLYRIAEKNVKGKSNSQAFYMYAGGGYGTADYYWKEAKSDNWFKNIDHSHDSFEAEVGFIYRVNAFSVMAGIQTNSFAYTEANIGIGVMF